MMGDALIPMTARKGCDPKLSVTGRTGLSRSSVYRLMERGEFPQSVPSGCATALWSEAEVDQWIEARKAERRSAAA